MHTDEHAELAALMRAVRAGCRLSLERLYMRTSDRLFGIVLRITRDRVDAEEVLQETYVECWNWRERFDENRGPVDLWLAGIAHSRALDSLRRRRVGSQANTECAVDNHQEYPDPALALSTARQTTLALALHDGLSRGEIALRLQQPIGTVKAWLRASLVDLRQERVGDL
jgi:RNA polymerase sigma-70 factor (ECF subfamily)